MQRRIVNAGAHAGVAHVLHDPRPVGRSAAFAGSITWYMCQLVIAPRSWVGGGSSMPRSCSLICPATSKYAFASSARRRVTSRRPPELPQADGRVDVGEVGLAARRDDVHAVEPAAHHALQAQLLRHAGLRRSSSAPGSRLRREVMFLLAWKLKLTRSPKEPIRRSFQREPMAWAASSITRSSCRSAMA